MLLTRWIGGLALLILGLCTSTVQAEAPPWLNNFKEIAPYGGYTELEPVTLLFNTHHPQGMTIIGDKIYLSSVEVINRQEGKGRGYLFELNMKGELLRTLEIGEGPAYHPSGLDFDGTHIWVSVAEYHPNSSSIIYRVDPKTMSATEVFRFDDHIGGIVSVPTRNELIGVNWGSRRIYRWKLNEEGEPIDAKNPARFINGNHFIDYQDGQWIRGTNYVLFGGVKRYGPENRRGRKLSVGGMALMELDSMQIIWTTPIPYYSQKGRVMNQNPFYVRGTPEGVWLYFIPDDNESVMYRYVTGRGAK